MVRPPRKSGNGPSRRPSAYRPRVAGRGRTSAAGEPQTPETTESPEITESPETTESPATTESSATAGTPEATESSPVKDVSAESADSSAESADGAGQGTADAAVTADGAEDSLEGTQDSVEGTAEPVAEAADTAEPVADSTEADSTEAADSTDAAETTAGGGLSLTKSDAGAAEARPTAKTRRVARVSTIKPNTSSKTSTTEASSDQDSKKRRVGSPTSLLRLSRRTLTVLGVITGVLVIAAIVLALHPGATIGPNKAFVDQAATTELVSQAQTKVCTANSANGTKFDEWSNKARAGLTGEALAQFNKQVAPLKQVMEQAKATTDCQIDAIGVRELTGSGDDSRAVIVVNMVLSGTQNGVPTQSLTPRYQVNMEKQGDSWLIAKVADI
ncbi:hypothetical protein [Gordonia sp. 852002-10350_SCH5691597]|uniref:hypothetical protein n=1 Tax=Gordonia sp. 852002-10350_SCH5691597 TaxID=1834085 RepID=UPI0007EBFAD4|nr:hypothetical protein [Gordonia sp. 852002-10350_SCH5691597]OBA65197.1 hypothetical protein A5777_21090 [Gordonia sp. 852002-10350_SCH5691597]